MRPARLATVAARAAFAALAVLALLTAASGPAGAEERKVEAVGVSGIDPQGRLGVARQRAVDDGITEAVYRVVGQELPALDADGARRVARRVVGGNARDYVIRFRVLEDRGTRPKEVSRMEAATHEYVVLVEASVDVHQVRQRLVGAGLLASGDGAVRRVELVLEELPSYAAYEAIREALGDRLQAEAVVPVEFTLRRAVLAVTTREDGRRLAERLAAAGIDGLRLELREAEAGWARVAVHAAEDRPD